MDKLNKINPFKKDDKDKEKGEEGEKNEEEKEEEEKAEEPEKIVEMKKGDYTVHVLIEEVKNLSAVMKNENDPEEAQNPPYPRVKISCFDQSKRTGELPSGVNNHVFNEHFYFDKTNLTKEMLDSEKIILEVYDTKHTEKENYLGIQEFDFSFIYSKDGHAIHNFWIALANPNSKDITKVRGYLKVSISILHENDPRIELEMKDTTSSDCFVPTQVKINYKQMTINLFYAQNIPDMDQGMGKERVGSKAECDGVVEVNYLGIKKLTKTVKMVKEVITWNQCIKIPVTEPAVSQKIVMTVKDQETFGKDDLVGSIELKIDDIKKGTYKECGFLDIYGSYENDNTKNHIMMNTNPEIGSRWKGRLCLSITYEDVEKAIAAVEDITDKDLLEKSKKCGRTNSWKLMFGIYDTLFLPEEKEKYSLRISWAEKDYTADAKKAENHSIYWGISSKNHIIQTTTNRIEDIPDVFIYLMDEKKKKVLCFQRLRCADIENNNFLMAIKLIPELTCKKVKKLMDSGIIRMKIGVFNTSQKINAIKCNEDDFKVAPGQAGKGGKQVAQPIMSSGDDLEDLMDDEPKAPLKQPEPVNEDEKEYTVVAVVYMTKGLLPADSNGKSDPYVTINLGKETKKTKVKEETVNGIWNEKLVFNNVKFKIGDKSSWPCMLIKIIDWNRIQSHKVMNYSYLWLSKTPHQIDDVKEMTTPKWFNMFLPKSNKKQGQLLLSFYIFSKGKENLVDKIKVLPETTPYTCEFNLLGLRGLKPLSLLPVKKAYIKFDLNSLNFTGSKEDSMAPIKTTPGDPGANPTINSIFKFDIHLPIDTKYIPELQCEVYDHILSGMVKSLLGVFTLNIKHIIQRTNQRIDSDLAVVKRISSEKLGKAILGQNFAELENIAFGGQKQEEGESEISTKKSQPIQGEKSVQMSDLSSSKTEEEKKQQTPKMKDNNLDENLIDDENNQESDAALKVSSSVNQEQKTEEGKTGEEGVDPGPLEQINGIKLPKKLPDFMLHDSKYFVRYPYFKNYKIPGYMRQQHEIKDFWVEDEEFIPDPNDFIEVGYLLKVETGTPREKTKKHYRRIYRKELEKVSELHIRSPFNEEILTRGDFQDTTDETSIFQLMSDKNKQILMVYDGQDQAISNNTSVLSASDQAVEEQYGKNKDKELVKEFGKFKAILRIAEKKKFEEYESTVKRYMDNPQFANKLKYVKKHDEICKKMLLRQQIIVRIYVLRLFDLAKKDTFSESDPFIKIYLGDKLIINESENHQDDMKNCFWNKFYDIPCEMPGCGNLRLEVWDYDDLLSDDLIGSTEIDLEDRWFDQNWVALTEKPVEIRPLYHPDESAPQGQAYLWLEMFPVDERATRPERCIELEPTQRFEVRFVVWETEEMEMMDVEGTSDIYVLGFFNIKDKQSTDVHYRCQTGIASFNWRMLLPVETPCLTSTLNIQAYDNDLFSSDDYICGAKLELREILKIPRYLDLPIKFNRDYWESLSHEEQSAIGTIEFESKNEDPEGIKFWVQCLKTDGSRGGRIMCSLEILPEWKAKLNPVGKGRDEPNIDPYLPPPFGRFQFTLNPYKLINQLVGPKFRRKCYCFICACLCCVYLCFVIPYVIYHLSGELVNPFNKF